MSLLRGAHNSLVCRDADQLCAEVKNGVGALLVSSEVLGEESMPFLREALRGQPTWSHIPILVLLDHEEDVSINSLLPSLESLGNVTLLDSPANRGH